ncbi:hypothetical protein [Virgibacillus ainsalahensis]
MTKELLEELFSSFTQMSDELIHIQENSYHMNEHITNLETRLKEAGVELEELQDNILLLNKKLNRLEPLMRTRMKQTFLWRAV